MTKIDDPTGFREPSNRPTLEILSAITLGLLVAIIVIVTLEKTGVLKDILDLGKI